MTAVNGRGSRDAPSLRFTPKIFVALLTGLLLAVLAFSQAAAAIGMTLNSFRPLGGSFFSWRSAQHQLAVDLFEKRKRTDARRLMASGRTGLRYAPLSARSLWMVGKGYEAQKDMKAARRVMARAQKVTRRDAAIQLWLAEDAFRREDVAEAIGHYDLIMRSQPETSREILPRLAAVMVARQGRPYLQPYINGRNLWYPGLMTSAVNLLPKAEPIGLLLIERKAKAPDIVELESVYGKLVTRLVDEGTIEVALKTYALLPNGKAEVLGNVSGIANGKLIAGYPPFIWSLANEAYGATLVGVDRSGGGMEFFAAPGTIGMAASKLIKIDAGNRLRWRIYDRTANLQSTAAWVATCVSGKAKGAQHMSINLLSQSMPLNKTMSMALPANCDVIRLDMRVAGGIGTGPASLIVGDLGHEKAAVAN